MPETLVISEAVATFSGSRFMEFPPILTAQTLVIDYESDDMPANWGFLGRAYKIIPLPGGNAIDEAIELRPNHRNVCAWQREHKLYYLQARLVRYIRAGIFKAYEFFPPVPVTKIYSAAQPATLSNIIVSTVNSVRYWSVPGNGTQSGYIQATLPNDWVEGYYSMEIWGRDAANVPATLETSVSGFIIDTVVLDAPSLVLFRHTVTYKFLFRAGMTIRITCSVTGNDRGLISLFKLVPVQFS